MRRKILIGITLLFLLIAIVFLVPLFRKHPGLFPKPIKPSVLLVAVDTASISGIDLTSTNEKNLRMRFAFAQREPYAKMPGGTGFALKHQNLKHVY